jgi:hypothetical protein
MLYIRGSLRVRRATRCGIYTRAAPAGTGQSTMAAAGSTLFTRVRGGRYGAFWACVCDPEHVCAGPYPPVVQGLGSTLYIGGLVPLEPGLRAPRLPDAEEQEDALRAALFKDEEVPEGYAIYLIDLLKPATLPYTQHFVPVSLITCIIVCHEPQRVVERIGAFARVDTFAPGGPNDGTAAEGAPPVRFHLQSAPEFSRLAPSALLVEHRDAIRNYLLIAEGADMAVGRAGDLRNFLVQLLEHAHTQPALCSFPVISDTAPEDPAFIAALIRRGRPLPAPFAPLSDADFRAVWESDPRPAPASGRRPFRPARRRADHPV